LNKRPFTHTTSEKVTDRQLMKAVATSVVSILFCILLLVAGTWAMFTDSATTTTRIVAGNFEGTTLVVTNGNETVSPQEDGSYFLPAGVYNVTFDASASTASNGYVRMTIADEYVCYTAQISPEQNDGKFQFVLDLGTMDASFSAVYCWGYFSGAADVDNGGSIRFR